MKRALITAAAVLGAAMAAAGCSSAGSPAPAIATFTPEPSVFTPAPAVHARAGALKITQVSCGRYTAAQRARFGTNAVAGAVYEVTNETGGTVTEPLQVDVSFITGWVIDGSNVNGSVAPLGPGQSEQVSVDNLTSGGAAGNPRDDCLVTGYGYTTAAGQWITSGTAS